MLSGDLSPLSTDVHGNIFEMELSFLPDFTLPFPPFHALASWFVMPAHKHCPGCTLPSTIAGCYFRVTQGGMLRLAAIGLFMRPEGARRGLLLCCRWIPISRTGVALIYTAAENLDQQGRIVPQTALGDFTLKLGFFFSSYKSTNCVWVYFCTYNSPHEVFSLTLYWHKCYKQILASQLGPFCQVFTLELNCSG